MATATAFQTFGTEAASAAKQRFLSTRGEALKAG
jgi:hypothetical protein